MTEQQKTALKLRAEELTHSEIAEKMGCSKQNVSRLLNSSVQERCYARTWRTRQIIYPEINKWLTANNISLTRFAKMCGYKTTMPIRRAIIDGRNVNKEVIDAMLNVTGMTYEVAFRKEDNAE